MRGIFTARLESITRRLDDTVVTASVFPISAMRVQRVHASLFITTPLLGLNRPNFRVNWCR